MSECLFWGTPSPGSLSWPDWGEQGTEEGPGVEEDEDWALVDMAPLIVPLGAWVVNSLGTSLMTDSVLKGAINGGTISDLKDGIDPGVT